MEPQCWGKASTVQTFVRGTQGWLVDGERVQVRLLDEDTALARTVARPAADAARRELVTQTLWIEPGRWSPPSDEFADGFDGWLGMLILDGLMVRQIHAGGMRCCELLGPGDVIRPWDEALESFGSWRVLEPTRLALLDVDFAQRAHCCPGIAAELMRRTLTRSQTLGVLLALTHARRADVRLRTLFWHLADRWGRVTPDGVLLSLRITHSLIAQLTGLRRPSVSVTLGELERSGEILRLDRGTWLMRR